METAPVHPIVRFERADVIDLIGAPAEGHGSAGKQAIELRCDLHCLVTDQVWPAAGL